MEDSAVNGRAKRRSAQAAEDAQLARAMQDEWMRAGAKKPKKNIPAARVENPVAQQKKESNAFPVDSTDDSGVQHFVTRHRAGFLEVDVRRGCCFCDTCAAMVANELISGSGLTVFRGAFSAEVAARAREEVSAIKEAARQTRVGELGPNHSRVWSLLNHGAPFTMLVTLPLIFKALSPVLGDDFALGSFSANDLGPGCPRGPAHVDYPYSTLNSFPSDVLACQAVFCLDAFTEANGGTQVELHSHKARSHPDREKPLGTVLCGDPGDLIIFNSLLHHRSGRNVTKQRRVALLGQFLAKYVRPMEDQVAGVSAEVRRGADKALRQLLALDYPFPILHPAHASSSVHG